MSKIQIVKRAATKGRVCTNKGKPRIAEPAHGAVACVNGVMMESQPPKDQAEQDFINRQLEESVRVQSVVETGIQMREAAKELAKLYLKSEGEPPSEIDDERIKEMVDRFLFCPLPEDFYPDCGIEFKPLYEQWPSGTNLLTASQAEEMIRFMLGK